MRRPDNSSTGGIPDKPQMPSGQVVIGDEPRGRRIGRECRSGIEGHGLNQTTLRTRMDDDTDRRSDDPRLGTREDSCGHETAAASGPCRMAGTVGGLRGRSGCRGTSSGTSRATGRWSASRCFPTAAATGASCLLSATARRPFGTNQISQRFPQTALLGGGVIVGRRVPADARRRRWVAEWMGQRQAEYETDKRPAAHEPSARPSPGLEVTTSEAGKSIPDDAHDDGHCRTTEGSSHPTTHTHT